MDLIIKTKTIVCGKIHGNASSWVRQRVPGHTNIFHKGKSKNKMNSNKLRTCLYQVIIKKKES